MSRIVEICPHVLGAVRIDVAATRDAIRDDVGPLRWRMSNLNVPTGALHDVLAVADRLDGHVLPTLDVHLSRARELDSLRYRGSMGASIPVIDGAVLDPPAAPFEQTALGDGTTALTWAAAPAEEQEADRRATERSRPLTSWFGDRWEDLTGAVDDGTDWLAEKATGAWEQVVEAGAEIGGWWETTTTDLGGWIDENLTDVRAFIGRHVAVFRTLADVCRIVGWVVVAIGAVLTVALAVIGAMGGGALGAVFGLGAGAVPGGGAGAVAGTQVGLKVLGVGFALVSVGDLLDVAADWGEGTIDGQDLVQRGALEVGLAVGSLVGFGALGKLLQKTYHHLPASWVAKIDDALERIDDRLRPRTGSQAWDGPDGLHLSSDEARAVDDLLARAARAEPAITADLQQVVARVDGATMPGLEFRLKGKDSLYRKIATDLAEDTGQPRDVASAVSGIKDAVRYTTQVPDDGFTKGVESVAKALAEDGFVPVSWKNTFGKPGYQGINSAWRSPDGQVFELQFHTPASFEAKMTTHELYELARLPNTTPTERARLEAEMQRLFGSVPTPPGVRSITSPEVR